MLPTARLFLDGKAGFCVKQPVKKTQQPVKKSSYY